MNAWPHVPVRCLPLEALLAFVEVAWYAGAHPETRAVTRRARGTDV